MSLKKSIRLSVLVVICGASVVGALCFALTAHRGKARLAAALAETPAKASINPSAASNYVVQASRKYDIGHGMALLLRLSGPSNALDRAEGKLGLLKGSVQLTLKDEKCDPMLLGENMGNGRRISNSSVEVLAGWIRTSSTGEGTFEVKIEEGVQSLEGFNCLVLLKNETCGLEDGINQLLTFATVVCGVIACVTALLGWMVSRKQPGRAQLAGATP